MSRLTWYQIFLVKMHLVYSIWSSSSVSVASYSFINLLFIIIIFFVLGLTALVNLALTNYFFFFALSWRPWLSNFSLFSSKLASLSSSLFYLFSVILRWQSHKCSTSCMHCLCPLKNRYCMDYFTLSISLHVTHLALQEREICAACENCYLHTNSWGWHSLQGRRPSVSLECFSKY